MDASLNTSAMLGKLMVRLRSDGLLSAEGADAILRNALASVAPPRRGGFSELFRDPRAGDMDGLFAAA